MIAIRIATFLKNHTWTMNLLFIALGSYFIAGGVNAMVARGIRVIPSVDDVRPSRAPASRQGKRSVTLENIAERNLFNAKRENLSPVQEAPEEQSNELSGSDYDRNQLKPCSLPLALRGTLVAEGAPQWSMALVHINAERDTSVFTINEGSNQLTSDAVLVDILDREMVVRRREHFELCSAEGEPPPQIAAASMTRAHRAPASATSEGDGEGVEKVSETEYVIDRTERDRVFDNLSEIATQARIVPSFKNGKPNGFKLFSIKPNSIFSKIGLQNGDVIQKVNGYEINSPDKALELYQRLKDTGSISVDLLRRGQNQSFSYQIQ